MYASFSIVTESDWSWTFSESLRRFVYMEVHVVEVQWDVGVESGAEETSYLAESALCDTLDLTVCPLSQVCLLSHRTYFSSIRFVSLSLDCHLYIVEGVELRRDVIVLPPF